MGQPGFFKEMTEVRMNAAATVYASRETVDAIVGLEWEMFQAVNEQKGVRASCQDDHPSFVGMRRSQFEAWSQEAAVSYLNDLNEAAASGRNLLAEKYIFMMIMDSPGIDKAYFRSVCMPDKRAFSLAEAILELLMKQTRLLRERYPCLGRRGRPFLRDGIDEAERAKDVSIQTYQMGELLTYSGATLEALLLHSTSLESGGTSIVEMILLNEMRFFGYQSLAEAEEAVRQEDAARSERQFVQGGSDA
jgi:hypothetical protein